MTTADAGAARRCRLLVAYDGAAFHGFAAQPGVSTVAGALAGALGRSARTVVELTFAGRTDAGVHAWGQVVSLDLPGNVDLVRVQRSVNRQLAPTVVVREASWAPPGFDARRWAVSRTYRYSIDCSGTPSPFSAATSWHVGSPLDVRGMQAASDALLGEHDFRSLCRPPAGHSGPLVRRVTRADWADVGDGGLRFEVEATAFCHQMVRSTVGLLVEVGRGRRRAADVLAVLRAADRAAAGPVAPPHGLCLWAVSYPEG